MLLLCDKGIQTKISQTYSMRLKTEMYFYTFLQSIDLILFILTF